MIIDFYIDNKGKCIGLGGSFHRLVRRQCQKHCATIRHCIEIQIRVIAICLRRKNKNFTFHNTRLRVSEKSRRNENARNAFCSSF